MGCAGTPTDGADFLFTAGINDAGGGAGGGEIMTADGGGGRGVAIPPEVVPPWAEGIAGSGADGKEAGGGDESIGISKTRLSCASALGGRIAGTDSGEGAGAVSPAGPDPALRAAPPAQY